MHHPIALTALSLLLASGCAATPQVAVAREGGAKARPPAAAELLEVGQAAAAGGLQPVTSFAAGVRAGDEAWRRNEPDLAVFLYVQALAFNDRDGETIAKIGAVHELRGNEQLARKAFELAVERSPQDARIAERLGLLCLRTADFPAAQKWLESARALAPDRWQTHEGLGLVALHERDTTAALRHFDAALALEPRSLQSRAGRGRTRLLAGELDAAEADLKLALAAGEGEWQKPVRLDLGALYAQRGQYADGLAMLLEVMPEAQAYNRLGEIAMGRRDYAGAERLFTKALAASPTFYATADRNLIIVREHLSSAPPRADGTPQPQGVPLRLAQGSVVVRSLANPGSDPLGYLQPSDPVEILRDDGEWSLVAFTHRATGDKRQGWVRNRYIGHSL
jgi:tetratricopeptide (TPR) repeat protein